MTKRLSAVVLLIGLVYLPCHSAFRIKRQAVTEGIEVEPAEALEVEGTTPPTVAMATGGGVSFAGGNPRLQQAGPQGVVSQGTAGQAPLGSQAAAGAPSGAAAAPQAPEVEVETPEIEGTPTTQNIQTVTTPVGNTQPVNPAVDYNIAARTLFVTGMQDFFYPSTQDPMLNTLNTGTFQNQGQYQPSNTNSGPVIAGDVSFQLTDQSPRGNSVADLWNQPATQPSRPPLSSSTFNNQPPYISPENNVVGTAREVVVGAITKANIGTNQARTHNQAGQGAQGINPAEQRAKAINPSREPQAIYSAGTGTQAIDTSGLGSRTINSGGRGTQAADPSGPGTQVIDTAAQGSQPVNSVGQGALAVRPAQQGGQTITQAGPGSQGIIPSGQGYQAINSAGQGADGINQAATGVQAINPQAQEARITSLGQGTEAINPASTGVQSVSNAAQGVQAINPAAQEVRITSIGQGAEAINPASTGVQSVSNAAQGVQATDPAAQEVRITSIGQGAEAINQATQGAQVNDPAQGTQPIKSARQGMQAIRPAVQGARVNSAGQGVEATNPASQVAQAFDPAQGTQSIDPSSQAQAINLAGQGSQAINPVGQGTQVLGNEAAQEVAGTQETEPTEAPAEGQGTGSSQGNTINAIKQVINNTSSQRSLVISGPTEIPTARLQPETSPPQRAAANSQLPALQSNVAQDVADPQSLSRTQVAGAQAAPVDPITQAAVPSNVVRPVPGTSVSQTESASVMESRRMQGNVAPVSQDIYVQNRQGLSPEKPVAQVQNAQDPGAQGQTAQVTTAQGQNTKLPIKQTPRAQGSDVSTVAVSKQSTVSPAGQGTAEGHWVFNTLSVNKTGHIRGEWMHYTASGQPSSQSRIPGVWAFQPERTSATGGINAVPAHWQFFRENFPLQLNRNSKVSITAGIPKTDTTPTQETSQQSQAVVLPGNTATTGPVETRTSVGSRLGTGQGATAPQEGMPTTGTGTDAASVTSGGTNTLASGFVAETGSPSQAPGQQDLPTLADILAGFVTTTTASIGGNQPAAVDVQPGTQLPDLTVPGGSVSAVSTTAAPVTAASMTEAVEIEPTEAQEVEQPPPPENTASALTQPGGEPSSRNVVVVDPATAQRSLQQAGPVQA